LAATITPLSNGVEEDSLGPINAMFSTLYSELHRVAKRELARLGGRASMSITTVLHEAYLDISERAGTLFPDQARFMGYAARVMRGLIIDHARRRSAKKRGGEFEISSLEPDMAETPSQSEELSLINDAMNRLEQADPELAQVVDLKFFCGLSFAEIAALQKQSERTVQRRWEKARIYLRHSIGTESSF
jgi:RNA polymerase sigma factor (TIGR02999 family)